MLAAGFKELEPKGFIFKTFILAAAVAIIAGVLTVKKIN